MMENALGGAAFAGLIAAQFLAVVAMHRAGFKNYDQQRMPTLDDFLTLPRMTVPHLVMRKPMGSQAPIVRHYLLLAILIAVAIWITMGSPHAN